MAGDTGLGATIANLGNIWESKVAPKIQASVDALDKAVINMNKLGGSFGGAPIGGGGNNRVSSLPPGAVAGIAAGGQALAAIGQAMPSTNMYVQQDLLTNRARFFAMGGRDTTSTFIDANGNRVGFKMGGDSNGISSANNNVVNLQNTLNQRGTITDQLDAAKALVQAQNSGLAGARNFNQVMIGNAAMSNITPGIGIQGSTQAYAAVQQGRSVNMLRAIGIQIRGMDGSMKPMPQIIDEVWSKLNREKIGGQPLTEQDILTSLQPGNALDSMLNLYFGNDSMLRSQVEQGLLIKAKTGGSRRLDSITKKELQNMGVTTAAVTSLSNRNAAASRILQQTAGFGAGGFTLSNQIATDLSKIANAMTPLLDVIAGFSTLFSGVTSIANGLFGKLVSPIAGLLGFGKREKGGPVDGSAPYIVGEKGPELFVPKSDGVVIPNHLLGDPHRKNGGPVKGMKTGADLTNFLVAQGFSQAGAEGVVGNLVWESGLDTKIVGDKGTSFGLAQWHGGRWTALNKFAKSKGLDPSSAEAQMQFLMKELNQKQYAGLLANLKNKDITKLDAAAQFMRIFERPQDQSDAAALKRANAYKGELGLSSSGGITDSSAGASTTSSSSSSTSIREFLKRSGDKGMGSFLKGKDIGASTSHVYHVGGVTVTIQGSQDVQATADAVASILTDTALRAKAGQK